MKTFALGAVGTVAGGEQLNWLSGLGTGAATALATYLQRRRALRPQRALLQHYLLFDQGNQPA